jgi:4-hydroxysphinganine ceramide fatty acyl 2-hydroxylase
MALIRYTPEILRAVDDWQGIGIGPSAAARQHPHGLAVLQNRWLERVFATSHVLMPGVWFLPLIAWLLWRSVNDAAVPWGLTPALFALGVLLWTLWEYLLHRGLFHLRPGARPQSKRRQFFIHGYHHEYPRDRWRLVAPPVMSWPLAAVIIGVYFIAAGPSLFLALSAGTASGYLAYDWIHFYTHHAKPTTRLGLFIQRHHLAHHYKDHTSHFGISSPLWDWVFGTYVSRAGRTGEPSGSAASTGTAALPG